MSEKKSSAKKSKQEKKLDASLKNLSAKQRREAKQELAEKRRTRIYIAIAVVVAVLVAGLLFWDGGTIQKHATALTIGERNYSAVDLDYYYYSQYNSAMSYASYYGIDTSVSLREQEAYEGQTWYEYFRNAAKSSLTDVSMLAQEGEAAGYSISEEGQANIDDAMADLDAASEEYGVSVNYYLRQMFGRYMTKDRYEKILTEYYYAYDYETYKTESFEISDDEIQAYYDEHKDALDTYDIRAYYFDASPETQYDEEGQEIEATEEEIDAAVAAAKENADKLAEAMKTGDEKQIAQLVEETGAADRSVSNGSDLDGYPYGDWVEDADRKAGDTTVIESSTGDEEDTEILGYYAMRFQSRSRDDYYPASIRNILIAADEEDVAEEDETETTAVTYDYDAAKESAEELQKTWQDNGGTEDAFAELAEEHSTDASSNGNGGLYNSVVHGDFADTINDWIFAADRKAGDVTLLKDEENHGYQLIYFVGLDDLYAWQQTAQSELQSTQFDDWYNETVENYDVTTTFMYRFVG